MRELDYLLRLNEITNRLSDDESLSIMEARIQFLVDRDFFRFWKSIEKLDYHWRVEDGSLEDESFIVFTAGISGRQCADILTVCGKRVIAFIDNDPTKQGKKVDGIPVMPVERIKDLQECKVISGNASYALDLKKQLKDIGAANDVIDGFCAFTGRQYFDVLKPDPKEVFIDAGAYDGGTILDFIHWARNDGYEKVYSFEPDRSNALKVRLCIDTNSLRNVELIPKGTWFEDTEIAFDNNGSSGSSFRIDNIETACKIPVTSIDNVTRGERVTYIKMDVEGCEMETLKGAEKTIRKWKPKLAVCVYHKPFDIVELPLKILDMNPDYRFYLRHYASNLCETVLYAE